MAEKRKVLGAFTRFTLWRFYVHSSREIVRACNILPYLYIFWGGDWNHMQSYMLTYTSFILFIYIHPIHRFFQQNLRKKIRSTPAAGFAALGYAAALAVSSPKALQPQGTERRLDITRCLGYGFLEAVVLD